MPPHPTSFESFTSQTERGDPCFNSPRSLDVRPQHPLCHLCRCPHDVFARSPLPHIGTGLMELAPRAGCSLHPRRTAPRCLPSTTALLRKRGVADRSGSPCLTVSHCDPLQYRGHGDAWLELLACWSLAGCGPAQPVAAWQGAMHSSTE